MSFPTPQSRNEAILQNMVGASNELEPPQSRIEALLLELLEKLGSIENVVRYIGVTTTEISDGATTNPITINGASVTAVNGDMVYYSGAAYTWNGSLWQETVSFAEIITRIEAAESMIGDLTDLETTDKTSIVDAVNEVKSDFDKLGLSVVDGAINVTYKVTT